MSGSLSGVADVVLIVAVIAFVLVRQLKPRRLAQDAGRWWLLPAVLVVMAVRQPGLIDAGHRAASAGLLAAGVLAGLATGAAWAWTSRIWADASGTVWAKGGKATAAVWAGGLVLRLVLYGIGTLAGVHQGGPGVMITVAALLLARTGVLVHRARGLAPAYRVPAGG